MSQWLKFLEFLNAFHNVSIGNYVIGGELSSLLSLGLLLDLILLILGLYDVGLKILPLALAVSLCVLHVYDDE